MAINLNTNPNDPRDHANGRKLPGRAAIPLQTQGVETLPEMPMPTQTEGQQFAQEAFTPPPNPLEQFVPETGVEQQSIRPDTLDAPTLYNASQPTVRSTLDDTLNSGVGQTDYVQDVLNTTQEGVDWLRASQADYNLPEYVYQTPGGALADTYSLPTPQPINPGTFNIGTAAQPPEVQAKLEELAAMQFYTDPTVNVTNQLGGFNTANKDQGQGGWSIGGLVDSLIGIGSLAGKGFAWVANSRGTILTGQGLPDFNDPTGGVRVTGAKSGFNKYELSLFSQLQPSAKGTGINLFKGTFGDYGTGLPGALNYTLDNILDVGNAVRSNIYDVGQTADAIRRGDWRKAGTSVGRVFTGQSTKDAFKGQDFSFLNDKGVNSVLGKNATGDEYFARLGLGFGLDLVTGLNPIKGAKSALVKEAREQGLREMGKRFVRNLDNPVIDITQAALNRRRTTQTARQQAAKQAGNIANEVVKTPTATPPSRVPFQVPDINMLQRGVRGNTPARNTVDDFIRGELRPKPTKALPQGQRGGGLIVRPPSQRTPKGNPNTVPDNNRVLRTPEGSTDRVFTADPIIPINPLTITPPKQVNPDDVFSIVKVSDDVLDAEVLDSVPIEQLAGTPNRAALPEGVWDGELLPDQRRLPGQPDGGIIDGSVVNEQLPPGQTIGLLPQGDNVLPSSGRTLVTAASIPSDGRVLTTLPSPLKYDPNIIITPPPQGFVKPPLVKRLEEIRDEVVELGEVSDTAAKELTDPVVVPTILKNAEENKVITVQPDGRIQRTVDKVDEAQRELIRLKWERERIKAIPNFALKSEGGVRLLDKLDDIADGMNAARKTITGGRVMKAIEKTGTAVTEELLDVALPTIDLRSIIGTPNVATLYNDLKRLKPEERVYTSLSEQVERSAGDLSELARLLGHTRVKGTLDAEAITNLRSTYGSIYSTVGYPVDKKAIKQYLKTGVGRLVTEQPSRVAGKAGAEQVIKRTREAPENVANQTATRLRDKARSTSDSTFVKQPKGEPKLNTTDDTIAILQENLEDTTKLYDAAVAAVKDKPRNKANIAEMERLGVQKRKLEESIAQLELQNKSQARFKKFTTALPDTHKPISKETDNIAKQVHNNMLDLEREGRELQQLFLDADAIAKSVDADKTDLLTKAQVEPQPLGVGTHAKGFVNDEVLAVTASNLADDFLKNLPIHESDEVLEQAISEGSWYTGTKFNVSHDALDPLLTQPTRNPLGLGVYYTRSADDAEVMAKAAVPENTPFTDLPVSKQGIVHEVKASPFGVLNMSDPVDKPFRDMVIASARAAGFEEPVIRSLRARLTGNAKRTPTKATVTSALEGAFLKVNPDTPVDEALFRQFEVNMRDSYLAQGISDLYHKADDGTETLVHIAEEAKPQSMVSISNVGRGTALEEAENALTLVRNNNRTLRDELGSIKEQYQRVLLGEELADGLRQRAERMMQTIDSKLQELFEQETLLEETVAKAREKQIQQQITKATSKYEDDIDEIINTVESLECL